MKNDDIYEQKQRAIRFSDIFVPREIEDIKKI